MNQPPRLNQRITFQAQTLVPDGIGGNTRTWADIATTPTVWAAARLLAGREVRESDRMNARATYLFTVRHRSDIDETMQILWNGEAYNIRMVQRAANVEQYINIEAQRGVATA